jgi:iron complex transport system substrate-binding protein
MSPGLRWRLHVGLVALACAALAISGRAHALDITDDRGAKVRFDAPPQRIVSLLPSLTETVCALGRCAQLVGVDRYSNWPASVRRLPQLGGLDDANVEGIVALRPDVVLLARSARIIARLESLGIRVLALEPDSHASARRVLLAVGELLAVEGAGRVWADIEAAADAAARSVPPRVRGTRVYFEVNSAPYAAGESSFIGQTLARLGVANVVPAALGAFPQLNPEFVVRANPDVIMVGDRGSAALAQRPGWSGIRAVREKRVCFFTAEQSDVLVRPGPRMAEAAQLMADCLRDKAP